MLMNLKTRLIYYLCSLTELKQQQNITCLEKFAFIICVHLHFFTLLLAVKLHIKS